MIKLIILFLIGIRFCYAINESVLLSPDIQTLLSSNIIDSIKPHLVFNHEENAEAWLNDMSHRLKRWIKDKEERTDILTIIQYESARTGLDPQIILSIITIESNFNKYAKSSKGAVGLMQIMPFWKKLIGNPKQDLFDLQTNIRYGCVIFRYYLEMNNWNIERSLSQYNGSNGLPWYPNLIMNVYNTYWKPSTVVLIFKNKLKYINYTND